MTFNSFPYALLNANAPIVDQHGKPTPVHFRFMQAAFNRTGAGTGTSSTANTGLVAGGLNQSTATVLASDWNRVDTGSGGVVMPAMQQGNDITVWNNTSGPVNVYPFSGAAIGTGVPNAPHSLPANMIAYYQVWSPTQVVISNLQTA